MSAVSSSLEQVFDFFILSATHTYIRVADGIIRLFRNYDPAVSNGPVQMVSSFRGLNEVIKARKGSGVVTTWKQSGGLLHVGGDSRIIRVWDAHTESLVMVCT